MKKRVINILGIIISLALLYFLFRGVDWHELWAAFKNARYSIVIIAILVNLFGFYFRTLRFCEIIRHIAPNASVKRVFPSIAAGYAANNLLPLRAGEFVRAYHAGKQLNHDKAALFSCVVVERIVDVATLAVILCVTMLFYKMEAWIGKVAVFLIIGLIFGIFILYMIVRHWDKCERFVPKVARKFARSLADGFRAIKSAGQMLKVVGISMIIWTVEATTIFFVAMSFGLNYSILGSVFVMLLINLIIIIPAAPGNFGTLETAAKAGFMAFAVPDGQATAVTLLLHGVQFLPITAVGLVFLIGSGVKLNDC
ncbi:MAG: flippase-like domain-containing protein [Clostridiales bacterium]|jgi:uncharacterized protein (TIRG00374 family)|nr:flippase-like domain-containing protein [Clostridiales bacterium]